jgi:DNA polymerase III delta subunit
LKQFKTIGLFGEKELIAILENKCEELTENNEDLKKKYKESNKTFIVIIVLIVIIVIIIIIIIRIQKTIL